MCYIRAELYLLFIALSSHLQIHTSLAGVPVMFREKKVFFPSSSSYSCTMQEEEISLVVLAPETRLSTSVLQKSVNVSKSLKLIPLHGESEMKPYSHFMGKQFFIANKPLGFHEMFMLRKFKSCRCQSDNYLKNPISPEVSEVYTYCSWY